LIGKKGRESDDEITLFDPTGMAAQDIAAANIVYQLAKKTGMGKSVTLLETSPT
jgi:alanine dehydrogenase